MAYIGSTPESQNFISGTDYFNGTGSQTAFTLTRTVNSVNDVEVVVNNVIQQPNSYTLSGTTLTLSAAPSSGTSNVYVRYLATNMQSYTVGNNTIDYNKLTSDMQSKFAMKNRIINGAMVINQRAYNGTPVSGNAQYTLDRYAYYSNVGSKQSVEQATDAPSGFVNSVKITTTAAYSSAAGNRFSYYQPIEGYNIADLGWGTASAKTVTLSFWVKSSLTGLFSGDIHQPSGTHSYVYTFNINSANTWEYKTITIVGPTVGTWATNNAAGLVLSLNMGAGSTYLTGTTNTWQAAFYEGATGSVALVANAGATFYITGVQLEVGSSATGFEYRQYGQELALCQRYYYDLFYGYPVSTTNVICNGQAFNSSVALGVLTFPVSMRSSPTMYQTSGSGYFRVTGNAINSNCDSLVINNPSGTNTVDIGNNTSVSVTQGYAYMFRTNNASARLAFGAEL